MWPFSRKQDAEPGVLDRIRNLVADIDRLVHTFQDLDRRVSGVDERVEDLLRGMALWEAEMEAAGLKAKARDDRAKAKNERLKVRERELGLDPEDEVPGDHGPGAPGSQFQMQLPGGQEGPGPAEETVQDRQRRLALGIKGYH